MAVSRGGDVITKLNIGPGYEGQRLAGFKSLDIIDGPEIDYVADAFKSIPIDDNVCEIVYASHVLEHAHWHDIESILREWVRIIKLGGWLEVWVPDGLKVCEAFYKGEMTGEQKGPTKAWGHKKIHGDPCLFANNYIFSMCGKKYFPHGMHKSLYSRRFLHDMFKKVGLINIQDMDISEKRNGGDSWINLGVKGQKQYTGKRA